MRRYISEPVVHNVHLFQSLGELWPVSDLVHKHLPETVTRGHVGDVRSDQEPKAGADHHGGVVELISLGLKYSPTSHIILYLFRHSHFRMATTFETPGLARSIPSRVKRTVPSTQGGRGVSRSGCRRGHCS